MADALKRLSRLLKKCHPALFQRAESGTCPDSASPDQALAVPDPRRVILDPRKQDVFQHPVSSATPIIALDRYEHGRVYFPSSETIPA
jgi:hypothetical protein